MTPNEVSFLIIAIAFLFLVIFIVWFLFRTQKTLDKVDQTLEQVRDLTIDANQKMKSIQPAFNTISNVSEGLEIRTEQFKKEVVMECLRDQLNEKSKDEPEIYMDIIDCALLGVNIWKKLYRT